MSACHKWQSKSCSQNVEPQQRLPAAGSSTHQAQRVGTVDVRHLELCSRGPAAYVPDQRLPSSASRAASTVCRDLCEGGQRAAPPWPARRGALLVSRRPGSRAMHRCRAAAPAGGAEASAVRSAALRCALLGATSTRCRQPPASPDNVPHRPQSPPAVGDASCILSAVP